MVQNKSDDIIQMLHDGIENATKTQVEEAFNRHMEAFRKEAEDIKTEVIAGVVMRLSKWYNFQNLGETLRIEVRKPEDERPY